MMQRLRAIARWIGPKLAVRAAWAGVALVLVLALAWLGVIPSAALQGVLTAIAALVGLL